MFDRIRKQQSSDAGFTLVELLITVNSALEAYYAQNKAYPTGTANVAITALVTANLLKSDPTATGGSLNGKTLTYDATKGTLTTTC